MESTSHPLAGKRIVVTRARNLAAEWIGSLEKMGAKVLLLPMVAFTPPEDWAPVDAALRRFPQFDWVLFTSQNAVGFFCLRWRELELDQNLFQDAKPSVAVVGDATARAAAQEGFHVEYAAKQNNAESLASELQARFPLAGKAVLLPRSDRAGDLIANALCEAGAHVTDVVAYRTAAPESVDTELLRRIRRADVDAILFASPSAFHNFSPLIGPPSDLASLSERVAFAAIGPTTARALRDAGGRVAIEAAEPSASSFADALAKYYERQPSTAGGA